MFMLYAVLIGLVIGLLLGGRIGRLADLRLEWAWLAIAALVIQVVLFTDQVYAAAGDLVPLIYLSSTVTVVVVMLRNVRKAPGLIIVTLGACANLAAIIANGGYMPATPEALGISEPVGTTYHANSVSTPSPALELLIDRFALPDWVPYSNVFSLGDVLIGAGIVIVMVVAMRQGQPRATGAGAVGSPAVVASRESTSSTVAR
jgi:hypothetical protein